ncbi:MAG: GAF domain-containing protein [Chloroflexi bacterium]|nr:GAF domain-containing protein [Chloroflexota bacterium]
MVAGSVILVLLDLLLAGTPVRLVVWVVATAGIGGASMVSLFVADRPPDSAARRWNAQALALAAVMAAAMALGPGGARADEPFAWALLSAGALLLGVRAAFEQESAAWSDRAQRLAFDAAIVGASVGRVALILLSGALGAASLAALPPALFAAAVYAVLMTHRAVLRGQGSSRDWLQVWGTCGLALWAAGEAAPHLGLSWASLFGSPSLLASAALAFTVSALTRIPDAGRAGPRPRDDSRLRFGPAVAAGVVIALLSLLELSGAGTRASFFGVILLFGLIVARLASTVSENRRLLRSLESSGAFEERLRDFGAAITVAAMDRDSALALVCKTAQMSFGAEVVHLWMVDYSTRELEAAEVLGPRRQSVLSRRMPLDDPTSLAARVARSGAAELVPNAGTAERSNPFLTVLMHAQCLLAVPIGRRGVVQGVLVCADTHEPQSYGPQELQKAELLASQVAVALDNAYQHDLQRRRLQEVTALFEFAQAAHTSATPGDLVKLLLPALKDRLSYTYAAVWLRDPASGTVRLAAGDSPGGVPLAGVRPSELAAAALAAGEPMAAGLGWAADASSYVPPRSGVRSQLAVPLVLKRRVVGVIDLESKQTNAYSLNDERLVMSIANYAALAIDNLDLVESSRQVQVLREMDRMKSELLGTVSHELRTPLGSIKGYATTLLTHDSKLRKEEKREFLEIIDSEADRLRELIENFLDLSRLEAGVLRIESVPVQLGQVARDVLRRVELSAPGHTFTLDWAEDPELPADSRRIYQVIQNLLTNAVKYSPQGGQITLRSETDARVLTVSVEDEGLGIPPRDVNRVFERFHRVGGERAKRIGGTGLGLAICKAFVEAHGGRIWVESEGEGKGSAFRFSLPLGATAGNAPPILHARSAMLAPALPRPKGRNDFEEVHRPRR